MIEKVLGQGGYGITYRATDHKTGQKVAVKEFFPDTLAYREKTTVISYPGERSENYAYGKEGFLQEAKTLAEFIGNENIVRIHSYFEENETAYFVMDYIEGKSFDEYIKEKGGKVSVEEAKNILVPVMDALDVVHSKGIVHRDVAPDNIYISSDGTVKLLDFGAARYSLGDKSRSLDVILKHGFAPKEQYTRRGKQGPYTDIYSLGATFYFAITGKRPPDSVDRLDEDDLIPPSNLGVSITDYQENAILQALGVQPAERFQSMAEFKKALLNERTATNQIFFTAPEVTASSVPQQSSASAQQGSFVVQQGSAPAQQGSFTTQQDTAPYQQGSFTAPQGMSAAQQGFPSAPQGMQVVPTAETPKNKKLIIGLSAAGAALVLLITAVVGIVLSNNRDVDTSGKDWISDNFTNKDDSSSSFDEWNFDDFLASLETPEPTSPATEEPEPTPSVTEEPETQEQPTYIISELAIVGNTAANINNLGMYAANGDRVFFVDENYRSLIMMSGSEQEHIYENQDGEFSCLSYYDEVLYFIYNGHAYMRNITDGSEATPIPQLAAYNGRIERLYVAPGCYFVYADGKLYRISRKTGEEEEWIAVSSPDNITFCDGWLYYIGENDENQSEIYRAPADNFNSWDYGIYAGNGTYSHPVAVGDYVYVLWNGGSTTRIYRYDSDMTTDNTRSWIISGLVNVDEQNEGNYAAQLNVIGSDLFFCAYNAASDAYSLYRVIGSSGDEADFEYELLSSRYSLYPCITGSEENYRVFYFDYDEESDRMLLYYRTYS